MQFVQPKWNFEQEPWDGEEPDETSFNLRAHFDRIPDERLREFDPGWTDQQVMDWDGNFKDDGVLLIACSERDVEVDEYRRVLAQCIAYRDRVRDSLTLA